MSETAARTCAGLPDWQDRTAEAQAADPVSMLSLYRAALRLRRAERGLGDGPMAWLPSAPALLAFHRASSFVCAVNLGGAPARSPPHTDVLLASGPLTEGLLPQDTAAWLRP